MNMSNWKQKSKTIELIEHDKAIKNQVLDVLMEPYGTWFERLKEIS